ncbi:radical SAM protein [Acrocarpospora phusangensis]|uniref:Radical SAM protein n=1 Tax=Acrocarpospora phusangensis TaxID=1070424 RepID=A0A919QBL4_9ACTN|nr:4Fe-4S single cluster domain-containing protein [Acrocarpospora phusangensis]GIH25912.1 radical SAM protein [Acrocarpospora phusangensis]
MINVAETCVGTRALGPGLRSVVWVQGCPFDCHGCVAPEWIPDRPALLMSPADLAERLLADPDVTGLTFSGGEPMSQAGPLAEVARIARRTRELTLITFTGHRLERLRADPPDGAADLLAETDVLIDGRYVAARNDGKGLRGSSNQRIHHLTERLRPYGEELLAGPRHNELRIRDGSVLMVGVPADGMLDAVRTALSGRTGPPS